ncbi:MAG: hypothetical protein PHD15_06520 [Clostridia bacterium]|nr:hypothetical protein [Clostridia bacterium]
MNKFLKIVCVVLTSIILIGLNNFKVIYQNISNDYSFFNSLEFINVPVILVLILLNIIIIFYNKKNRINKFVISFFIIAFLCSFLNGVFIGKNIVAYVLIYSYILFMTYLVMLYTKQRFEISLVSFVSLMLLTIFSFSLFNLLFIVKYLVLITAIIGFVLICVNAKKNGSESLKQIFEEKFSSYGVIIFSILFIICVMGGIGRYVHVYDEYSHWAFDAKAVIYYDELSTSQDILSRTRQYPPIITLWQYFINIFTGFNEQNLYIGLNLFVFIYLMPIFSWIRKKNLWISPLLCIVSVISCFLLGGVYSYNTLYADLALSTVFACNFFIYLLYKDDSKNLNKFLFLTLSILILTKPTGIIMAGVFIFVMLLIDYFKFNEYNIKPSNLKSILGKLIKKWGKLTVLALAVYFVWFGYVKFMNNTTQDFYDLKLIPAGLETSLKYKLNLNVIGEIGKSLLKSFDEPTIYGIIQLSFLNFIIVIFLLLFYVFYLKHKENYKLAIKKVIPYLLGYIAFYLLTFLSVFIMFSVYEATILASFGRYLSAFNYVLIILIIAYISREEFLVNKKNISFTVIFYLLIIMNVPFSNMTYFVSDYKDRINTRETSYSMQEKFKIVNENTEENSMVYVLNQRDIDETIMPIWYARYYIFPRKVNASSTAIDWKIRTDKNVNDLGTWGLTAKDLAKNLYDYKFDYLFLYSYDNEMFEEMKFMFDDYTKVKQHTLFKIIRQDNNVMLTPVV